MNIDLFIPSKFCIGLHLINVNNLNILTEEIFVRVYEDRMDLLRAVIVGPFGTPYQDGLFFFDFHLPPEYPDVPPVRHYFNAIVMCNLLCPCHKQEDV